MVFQAKWQDSDFLTACTRIIKKPSDAYESASDTGESFAQVVKREEIVQQHQ